MSLELQYGYKRTDKSSDVDMMQGPYSSLQEACNVVTSDLRELGRTVKIIESGKVVEYWWESGYNDADLVLKQSSAGVVSGSFKSIIKDGEFTAEKITDGEDNGKFAFKIEGDESLKWLIGNETHEYPLDDNEWNFLADALGVGVEKRIDAVSYSNTGDIHCWKGTEIGSPAYPNIPENHILKAFVIVGVEGAYVDLSGNVSKYSESWIGLDLSGITVPGDGTILEYDLDVHGNQRNIHITHVPAGVEELVIRQFVEFEYQASLYPMWSGAVTRIYNRTNVPIKVLHGHLSHPNGKPIYILHNKNLIINPTGSASFGRMGMSANFRYVFLSDLQNINTTAEGIEVIGKIKVPDLGDPEETMVVTVLPEGVFKPEKIQELWVYDDTITPYNLANLQALYPTSSRRLQGFEVRCRLLTPPTTYRKESDNDSSWIKIEAANVT